MEEKKEYIPSEAQALAAVSVNVEKNNFNFLFLMPAGSTYQDCHDAVVEVSKKIQEMAQEAVEKQKKEEEKKEDGPKE